MRQQDLITPDHLAGLDIDLAGAGSLGGAIVLALCKMGCGLANIVRLSDPDVCEIQNLPTQWFRKSHVVLREPKALAVAEMVQLLCERTIEPRCEALTGMEPRPLGPIVILAVDSIEERAKIWGNLSRRQDVRLLIDARMGVEIVEIHAVVLGEDSSEVYASSLHAPEESLVEPCTRRAVVYTTFGAAAFVASLVRAHACREPFPRYVAFDFRHFMVNTDPASAGLDGTG